MTSPIYAIGYARVSSAKQAIEGDSLDNQALLIGKEIAANGCTVFPDGHVLQEPFTGSTDDRRVYRYALELIRKNPGKVKYFVIRSLDRFSREGSRRYEEMKEELASLGVELRDTARVIQPKVNSLAHLGFEYPWSKRSPSAVSEAALAEVHREQRGQILDQLVGAQIRLVQAGYHVGQPNDGYISRRIFVDGKKRVAQFPHPERAPFYRRMFEMRAEGTFSDPEIVKAVNAMGFRMPTRNRWNLDKTHIVGRRVGGPLTVKQLQVVIRNPVYAGIIVRFWTHGKPIRARGGEPLVSFDLYNRANRGTRVIEERSGGSVALLYEQDSALKVRRHKFRPEFPYKNVIACDHCSKPLVASASRGRSGRYYGAYHCARSHARFAVPQSTLDATVGAYLAELRPRDGTWARTEIILREIFARAEKELCEVAGRTSINIAELEQRKDQLVEAFAATSSATIRADLERKAEEVEREIELAREAVASLSVSAAELDEFLAHSREIVEHPAQVLQTAANLKEQLALFSLIFERRPTYAEIVSRTAILTIVFNDLRASDGAESEVMHPSYLDWNQLSPFVARWQTARVALQEVLDRMRTAVGSPRLSIIPGTRDETRRVNVPVTAAPTWKRRRRAA